MQRLFNEAYFENFAISALAYRKALDDIIFGILGLTEDERREVYWAVCELVKNRLEKEGVCR